MTGFDAKEEKNIMRSLNNDQKFQIGDLVHVKKITESYKKHFTQDFDAVVLGSSDDLHGGGDIYQYGLFNPGTGPVYWYEEDDLELVKKNEVWK